MANIRSAAKRARQSEVKRERNRVVKSTVKTAIKRFLDAIEKKDAQAAAHSLTRVSSALQKAARKKRIPQRRASRKLSRLTLIAKKNLPEALTIQGKGSSASTAAQS